MAVSTDLQYESIHNLFLDPMNPRLGRHRMSPDTAQEELLEIMRAWVLDELAYSYLESGGFWTHEPVIAVREVLYGKKRLIVVEGNRRLAALKLLYEATQGHLITRKWTEMLEGVQVPERLFERIPYVLAESRQDVQAFLGFRHVTGIKQWDAAKKAAFIVSLIDDSGMSYEQVAKKIGSKAPTVRKHYVAYRLFLQIENTVDEFNPEEADRRFTVLYMTLAKLGAQQYLHIDITALPKQNRDPVPKEHLENLAHFSRWLFGTKDRSHIVRDTRQVDDFGKILESTQALEYLESAKEPKFEIAFRIAGGDEQETISHVNEACDNVQLALMRAHAFKHSDELRKAVSRLGTDTFQLLNIFPSIKKRMLAEDVE